MRAERFGSYSIVDTLPGMPALSRLKSMTRYSRLWPPPRHQMVCSPVLLRPPDGCSFSVSGACGVSVVISSNVSTVIWRRPGVTGLYFRIGINPRSRHVHETVNRELSTCLGSLEEVRQLLARAQRDVGLLPVRTAADVAALALQLAARGQRAHVGHFRAQQFLDRPLDIDLVGVFRHLEHDGPAIVSKSRGLLRDQRTADDFGKFHGYAPSAASSFSTAALVSTTCLVLATSRAVTRLLCTSDTPSRLRTDIANFSSSCASTSTALPVTPMVFSTPAAALVLTSVAVSASITISEPSCSFCISAARSAPFSTFFGIEYS